LVLIFNSCCNESNQNFGFIICELNIDGFHISNYHCLNLPDTACIRDSVQFSKIFKISGTDSDCEKIKIPEIDFEKYSILINHKFDKGKKFYQRNVEIDSLNKIVTYLIDIESCMILVDSETESYNIVIVPKIDNNYKIDYK